MPRFSFRALASDGSEVSGELSAPEELQALDQIARRGLVPVALAAAESQAHLRWWQRDISLTGSSAKLPRPDQERIISTLASLLSARLPLLRALTFCLEQTQDARARRALSVVRDAVESGAPLASAMADAIPGFSDDLLRLVESGESSNRLDRVLAQTASALAAEARIRRELSGALIYPGLLLALATGVMLVLALYLAPTLLPVFTTAGAPAPITIRALAAFGEIVRTSWITILSIGGGLAIVLWIARDAVQSAFRYLALKIPGLGTTLRRRETLRVTQTLSLMLESGAPLLKAVAAARESTANPPFIAALTSSEEALLAGRSLSSALSAARILDPMAMTLIAAGEESDQLAATLPALNILLEGQISQGIGQLIRLITPVLTLAIGFGVGSIILATISAIMDMNDLAF